MFINASIAVIIISEGTVKNMKKVKLDWFVIGYVVYTLFVVLLLLNGLIMRGAI